MHLHQANSAPAASLDSRLPALAIDNSETRRSSIVRNVPVLGAVLAGVAASGPVALQASTTIFDRLQFIGANSEVVRSSVGDAFGTLPIMAGSMFDLSSATILGQYQIITASGTGAAFTQSTIGAVGLNIYQFNPQTNLFDKLMTLGGGVLSDYSGTNRYGDDIQTLQWNFSDVTLNPGTYVVAPFQTAWVNTNPFYLNFVDPSYNSGLGLNDWSAVYSDSINTSQVSFETIAGNLGPAIDASRFADRLTGLAVPEPSQALLVLSGLAAILMRRWRMAE
jgi:hypothetical protein